MITSELVLSLLLILTAAWILGILFSRFGLPVMLGELLAGVILGPPVLGIVTNSPFLQILRNAQFFVHEHKKLRRLLFSIAFCARTTIREIRIRPMGIERDCDKGG